MSNRSTYLARTLVTRAKALAGSWSEDESPATEDREQMRGLVAKVLAVEEGITEESKVRLVLDALPTVRSGRMVSERDMQDLAACLEAQLWREESSSVGRGLRTLP